jgi:hypothetical protein
MLLKQQAQRLFELSLAEFAPEWDVVGGGTELSLHNPEHWVSGIGTYGFTIRHRFTRMVKVLGRRSGPDRAVSYHRGVSYRVLEAYSERITDPVRRYFEEIGVVPAADSPASHFLQAPRARSVVA